MTVKKIKVEVEMCECGHEAPLDYIVYDSNGCGTCMPCQIEYMAHLIKSEKNKNKKLRLKIKQS